MIYFLLKQIHVTCVVLSGSGFFVRGILMLRDSPVLNHSLVRTLPHLLDSLLLLSALGLAYMSQQYPFAQSWLSAKMMGLILYIALGSVALKRGKSKKTRALAFVMALVIYAYIVSVAVSRSPWLY